MSLALTFVLLVLSVDRLVRLITADKISERAREALFNRWPYDSGRAGLYGWWDKQRNEVEFTTRIALGEDPPRASHFGYWLHCPWCLGLWLSAAAVALLAHYVSIPLPMLWAAACSHVVGILARFR